MMEHVAANVEIADSFWKSRMNPQTKGTFTENKSETITITIENIQ
jgi:hypothetical protein